jgi:hypothetical protein
MKRFGIFFLYLCLNLTLCHGQENSVVGIVTDEESGGPVAGAIVQVVGGKVYAITDKDGCFSLKGETSQIRVQSMGYRCIVVDVAEGPMHIKMKPEATQLKDVIVKAPDIIQKSDTLVYSMSKWAHEQDRNIADVLRRLPGVEVAKDGTIKYNGEPINKFYIDGSDFVNDRYGVATNNISPDDVASVEIMENHQPVKVLEGLEFSQQAGLNIKLKEAARARWIGILNGGMGAEPLLYDASLFAMRIAKKWQNMETLRMNDSGWNPSSQSQRHTDYAFLNSGYNDNPWPDYIAIGTTYAPLDELRTRDNLSFLAQSSNARHIADGFDVKLNATYQADRLDFANSCTTRYFDKNIPSFLEQNTMRSHEHQLNGEWSLQLNRRNNYLKDNLSVDALWNRAASAVSGTQSLRQQSDLPALDITNDLQLVRRIDSRLLTISLHNRYSHQPHSLAADSVLQDLTADDFRSVTEARYGWLLRRWSLYARGGIDLNLHRFQSSLGGLVLPDYPLEGRRDFTVLKTYASPEARYQHHRWWLTLTLPIGYYYYHVADRLADTSTSKHFVSVSPMVYVRHQLTAKTDLSAYLNYSLQPVAPSSYTQTVIMSDFRNLTFQTPSAESMRQRSAFVRLRYRNPITSLFANLSVKYQQDYQPLMQNQLFIGDRILTEFVACGNDISITQLNGGISKGLWSAKITVGIDASLGHSSAKMMRQNVEQPYNSTFITLAPKFTGKFTRWLSTDYRLTYTNNQYKVDAVKAIHNALRQNLSVTFLPTDQWHIAFGAEHYYTRFSTGKTASITFLDASVRWLLSKRIDLALAATNLLDETNYRYTSFGSLSESFYSFNIRPRNIIIKMQIKI